MPYSPINYDSPKELKAFLDNLGLGMRKKFGQNFLINRPVREKLIDALGIKTGDKVWELGPGLGAMTCGLLDRGVHLTAFEIDPAFCKILKDIFSDNENFSLVEGDALRTWPAESAKLVNDYPLFLGNLPYNAGAALMADFMEKNCLFPRMVVAVQKETAQRMIASPDSKDYSSFSVLCASLYRMRIITTISGQCFYPVPRVQSQGVLLELLCPEERITDLPLFRPLVRSLFLSRRKIIRNKLISFASSVTMNGMGEKAAEDALSETCISGERRAETLSVNDFRALALALGRIRKNEI